MSPNKFNVVLAIAIVAVLIPRAARAQDPIGVRAQGMAGAFVGVADDATAVYWNPSGLATGAFLSFVLDYGQRDIGPQGGQLSPNRADRQTGGIAAFGAPPVGFAYYRIASFGAGPRESVVMGVPGREEVRRSVHEITTSTLAVAVLQSIGDYLVVGGTLKLISGSLADGESGSLRADQALDDAQHLSGNSTTRGDVDVSAMSALGHIRLGVVGRNLTTPEFSSDVAGSEPVELKRQVRVGAGWGSGWPGISRVIVALDADVMNRVTPYGDRRDLAAGTETWFLKQRLGLRAGVRGSTVGDARWVGATGVSAAVKTGIYLEGHIAGGQQEERSWSVGARFTF